MLTTYLTRRAVSFFALLAFVVIVANSTMTAQAMFTVAAVPSSITIPQSGQGVATISTTISGGFNGPIGLTAGGVPVGVSVSFNPRTIAAPGSGTSTMEIGVARLAQMGTYPITVIGSSGLTRQTATVTLTITAPTQSTFAIACYYRHWSVSSKECRRTLLFTVPSVAALTAPSVCRLAASLRGRQ